MKKTVLLLAIALACATTTKAQSTADSACFTELSAVHHSRKIPLDSVRQTIPDDNAHRFVGLIMAGLAGFPGITTYEDKLNKNCPNLIFSDNGKVYCIIYTEKAKFPWQQYSAATRDQLDAKIKQQINKKGFDLLDFR